MNIFIIIMTFLAGAAVGALAIYKWEEYTLTTMFKQTAELEKAQRELNEEREEYRRTRAMFQAIDDVPEYLRDKYDISNPVESSVEIDEDYDVIYG